MKISKSFSTSFFPKSPHLSRRFTITRSSRRMVIVLLSLLTACFAGMGQALAYKDPTIYNHALHAVNIEVQYLACHNDDYQVKAAKRTKDKIVPSRTKRDVGRDGCLITGIALKKGDDYDEVSTIGGKKAFGYNSSGTSYGEFHIVDRGNHYLVMSRAEVDAEKYADHGTPGFLIKNRSDYPVTVSLDQIGCLYHDVIKPGATWKKTTGAVWFTISANTSMDGKDHINDLKDCVYPVLKAVKFVAELGASIGGCATCGEAAVSDAEMFTATLAGTALYDSIVKNTTADKLTFQYAGPPYPFRCMNQPEYEITGGPSSEENVTLTAADEDSIRTENCVVDQSEMKKKNQCIIKKEKEHLLSAASHWGKKPTSKDQISKEALAGTLYSTECTSKKLSQELAACSLIKITPEMKKKHFASKIAAGNYDRLAGTPLTIKRTGGGCT